MGSAPAADGAESADVGAAPGLARRCAYEALGTAVIVGGGCGAIALGLPHVAIAAAFGASVLAGIVLSHAESGAHLNPAVTLMMAYLGDCRAGAAAAYVTAQCVGATAAAAVVRAGATVPAEGMSSAHACGLEAVLTFILCACVLRLRVLKSKRIDVAMVAGFVVALEAFFAGPLTGASMNPARSLGPALVAGKTALELMWVYVSGPVLGAVLALCGQAVLLRKQSA
eukprot:PRCOL_00001785-RA